MSKIITSASVIGSGPNGLTSAILLARAGVTTTIFEAEKTIGGATRSANLTLPGFVHDTCSAVHPLARSSPAFARFPLTQYGLEWVHPPAALAHPLDEGPPGVLFQSVRDTARLLDEDGPRYRQLMQPLADQWNKLVHDILGPFNMPASPLVMARFGLLAAWPAETIARIVFRTERGRALFAGNAGHACLPLDKLPSGAFGWVLAVAAHGANWPVAKGGSQKIADALAAYFRSLGGRIETGTRIDSLGQLDDAGLILCDVTPRQLLALARGRLPDPYRRSLERFRYGPGVFKVDWALSEPIPWRDPECALAATVHLGGTLAEIAASERAPWDGRVPEKPFVLLAQPTLFDRTRAPEGRHTGWAYCHVPNGSSVEMTERIESQVERFAPGFRDTILARHTRNSGEMEQSNANLVGGDINGGAQDLPQLLLRPNSHLYRTPLKNVYLCSSSTPPGGGVHGMCGFHAATIALKDAGLS